MWGTLIFVQIAPSWPSKKHAAGVSVRVPVGAVTAVTGVAGAGKSSLASASIDRRPGDSAQEMVRY